MPGLMSRLSLIFKARLSKALGRRGPNETLDYSYQAQLRGYRTSSVGSPT
jgi:hypothetical protein